MLAATHKSRPALSLVEVLVVIGIMGLLVGLTLSAIQAARGSAARVGCANNLRQLGLAATSYHDAHGALPQPYVTMWKFPGHDAILPWTNLLLPYLEQEALWRTLYAAYQTDAGYVNPPHVGLTTVVKVYTCPADGRLSAPIADDWGFTAAYSSYLGVVDTPSRPTAMAHFGGVREPTGRINRSWWGSVRRRGEHFPGTGTRIIFPIRRFQSEPAFTTGRACRSATNTIPGDAGVRSSSDPVGSRIPATVTISGRFTRAGPTSCSLTVPFTF